MAKFFKYFLFSLFADLCPIWWGFTFHFSFPLVKKEEKPATCLGQWRMDHTDSNYISFSGSLVLDDSMPQ